MSNSKWEKLIPQAHPDTQRDVLGFPIVMSEAPHLDAIRLAFNEGRLVIVPEVNAQGKIIAFSVYMPPRLETEI